MNYFNEQDRNVTRGKLEIELIDQNCCVMKCSLHEQLPAYKIVDLCAANTAWCSSGMNVYLDDMLIATTEM